MCDATGIIPTNAPFRWRVCYDTVAGNGLPASNPVRLRLVFLPVRRIFLHGGRGGGGGRLKPVVTFLSLLHVKVQKWPLVFVAFHFGPLTFNFVYGPDFCYISFDLVRLGLSIAINSILMFHFGPPFNFRIGLKRLNIFGTEVSIVSILSFN